jgi:hypothetical protein
MGGVVDQRSQWSRMIFSSSRSRVKVKTRKPTSVPLLRFPHHRTLQLHARTSHGSELNRLLPHPDHLLTLPAL